MSRLLIIAIFVFSTLAFFSSGVIDSEDGWLYFSVAKNLYYTGKPTAVPNEFGERKNVNLNSSKDQNGEWHAPYAFGYSLSMVPAVFFSDLVHKYYNAPPVQRFPLEHDWSLHFFASFTNMFYAAFLAVIAVLYAQALGISKKQSHVFGLLIIFTTNLFPLSKFSFAHLLFTSSILCSFYCIKKYAQTQNLLYVGGAIASFAWAAIGYNIAFALVVPALVLYFLLLQPQRTFLRLCTILAACAAAYWQRTLLIDAIKAVHLKTELEGVWGLLLSPGKSMFLYSPPLLLIPLFWHKLNAKYKAEIWSFTLLALTFIGAYASARLTENVYIWHGGMSWGPRYVSPLIPFGMLFVFLIFQKLKRWQKIWIAVPLFVIGLGVQIIGVSNSYLVQYRNIPYHIFIGDIEQSYYDYPSFIPRFSPLLIMTHELYQRIHDFPFSVFHGKYNVRFVDGFLVPLHIGRGFFRGFREQGIITFDQNKQQAHSIAFDFYNAPNDPKTSSFSAKLTVELNNTIVATVSSIPSEQHKKLSLSLPSNLPTQNLIRLTTAYPATTSAQQVLYIANMNINDTPINLGSYDYPDLSSLNANVPHEPYRYFGKTITDPWEHWHMRARITENVFDYWWVKNLYYWDRPQLFIWCLFALDLSTIAISGWYTIKFMRYT